MRSTSRPQLDVGKPPSPMLTGHRVLLRPVTPDDYEWLLELSTSPELGFRWRYPPGTLDPAQLANSLWQGTLAQFLIVHRRTDLRLGLVTCYGANTANRTAYVAIVTDPGVHRQGWPLEGFRLFLNYLFRAFDLRKLYAEAIDYNFQQYASVAATRAVEEGLFRAHQYVDGSYHDVYILAFYRSHWLIGDARPDKLNEVG